MQKVITQKAFSSLKTLIILFSLGGVLLSLSTALYDGYSTPYKRLLYFTAQSNIWLGVNTLCLLFFPHSKRLYRHKFLFTVSITITGLVYCFLLGPFSDNSFHPWSIPNLFTHLFSPIFAVIDFFLDENIPTLYRKDILNATLPPLFYFSIASVLYFLNVDFGRGAPYPYFFMHYRSPARLLGFSREFPFFIGSIYWFALFTLLTLSIATLYAKLKNKRIIAGMR